VDCAQAFNNFGCNGGLPSQAFEYIKYNGGLDTEESYPYKGVNGLCQFEPNSVGVKVADSVNITLVSVPGLSLLVLNFVGTCYHFFPSSFRVLSVWVQVNMAMSL
jgi:Papain family cysteine protease